MMKIEGVGWDLGGTLSPRLMPIVDRLMEEELSEIIGDGRWSEVASEFRRDEDRYWASSPVGIQPRASTILSNALDRYQIPRSMDLAEAVLSHVQARFINEIPSAEYVTEVLERFTKAGIKLAVLSNWMYDSSWIIGWMTRHGLAPYFSYVRCSSDMAFRKPHKMAFIDICSGLGLKPPRMAFIGNDLLEDVTGSLCAGFAASVLVGGSASMIEPLADKYPSRRVVRVGAVAEVFEALS